ncbi:hypothetical protein R1sor_001914 [Riccia sorocarpa]|uniref:Uncharacterized protein n=1 Tax=Riccia sorocarpa TaxID=122646 RepID=A0ABD3GZT2_9MARC
MNPRDFAVDVSDEALHENLQRLAEAQNNVPPVKHSRFVQLTQHGEREHMREVIQRAVVSIFYGVVPSLEQFKACVGDLWKLGGVTIEIVRTMPKREMFFAQLDSHLSQLKVLAGPSPVIKGSPSVTLPYLPVMDSASYVSPIRPTWVELVDLPSFCTVNMLTQLLSAIGAVVRIPYLSQKLAFASLVGIITSDCAK